MLRLVPRNVRSYAWVILLPLVALLLVEITKPLMDPMLGTPFLAAVFLVSRFVGFRAAVAATLLSVLLLDFFVLPPVLSFDVSRQSLSRLVMFAVIAIVTAGLAARSRAD